MKKQLMVAFLALCAAFGNALAQEAALRPGGPPA